MCVCVCSCIQITGSLMPFTSEPTVEELQTGLGLVEWHHVAGAKDAHESEVAAGLDLADLLALVLVVHDLKVFQLGFSKLLVAGPFKGLGPGLVAEPVADEVGITGVDENWDLLEHAGDETMVWLHPVTMEEEITVNAAVAALVGLNFDTKGLHDRLLVEPLGDGVKLGVAERCHVLTLGADVIGVHAGLLVRSEDGAVAVHGGGDTDPGGLGAVAGLDQGKTTLERVVHGAASTLVQNSRVASLAAGHRAVLRILGQGVGQSVADEGGLEVDVSVLVGENLSSKDWDVVSGIGFTGDVEVLGGIFGELLEKQGQKGVDVLSGSNGVGNGRAAVGEANVDWLV